MPSGGITGFGEKKLKPRGFKGWCGLAIWSIPRGITNRYCAAFQFFFSIEGPIGFFTRILSLNIGLSDLSGSRATIS
jgi:hypothetical protein